ncbi:MAG: T9SS type A sorting domain-containing protein, partial [Bacteroidota bacterium]
WVNNIPVLTNITAAPDQWTTISTNWTATFSGNVTLSIRQAQRGGNDDFGIDNIQFTECQTTTGDPLKDIAWLQPFVGNANYAITQCILNGETIYILTDYCFVSDGTTYYYDCKGNLLCELFQAGGTPCSLDISASSNCNTLQACSTPNMNVMEERRATSRQQMTLNNFPNPFRNNTTIAFTLPNEGEATIEIFDTNGKVVFTQNDNYSAGEHRIELNTAQQLSAGIYYYRLSTNTQTITKSMMVLD